MSLRAITAFRLTSADPDRLARFYVEAIGCALMGESAIPDDEIALLGLEGGGRRVSLAIGGQRIDLDAFDRPGRAYPEDSTAADLWFQHLAIVTSDTAAAWTLAERAGAAAISRGGAITLPASSGGVTAVKFRDPEGHPLEFLQFPDPVDKDWEGRGILGIDHSAISVADIEASRRFYAEQGLRKRDGSFNRGPEQVALDGVDGVEVDVSPLAPDTKRPHLELLGYGVPRGRVLGRIQANDIVATRIVWSADRDALLRDPDGHLHLLRR